MAAPHTVELDEIGAVEIGRLEALIETIVLKAIRMHEIEIALEGISIWLGAQPSCERER